MLDFPKSSIELARAQKSRVIRDPVWGDIDVTDPGIVALIGHPIVQRLRRIRMLGLGCETSGGGNHSRFAHTLGVLEATARFYRRRPDEWHWWRKGGPHYRMVAPSPFRACLQAVLHHITTAPFSLAGLLDVERAGALLTGAPASLGAVLAAKVMVDVARDWLKCVCGRGDDRANEPCECCTLRWRERTTFGDLCRLLDRDVIRPGDHIYGPPGTAFVDGSIPLDPNQLDALARNAHYLGLSIPIDHRLVPQLYPHGAREQGQRELPDGLQSMLVEATVSLWRDVQRLFAVVYADGRSLQASAAIRALHEAGHLGIDKWCGMDLSHHDDLPMSTIVLGATGQSEANAVELRDRLQKLEQRWVRFDDLLLYSKLKHLARDEARARGPRHLARKALLGPSGVSHETDPSSKSELNLVKSHARDVAIGLVMRYKRSIHERYSWLANLECLSQDRLNRIVGSAHHYDDWIYCWKTRLASQYPGKGPASLGRSLPSEHWWVPGALVTLYHAYRNSGRTTRKVASWKATDVSQFLAEIAGGLLRDSEGPVFSVGVDKRRRSVYPRMHDSVSRLYVLGYLKFDPFPPSIHGDPFGFRVKMTGRNVESLTALHEHLAKKRSSRERRAAQTIADHVIASIESRR